ncbi:MAG: polysaccharide biosynthesis/export family protein [Thermodesulfovibrionales bacterium]
MIDHGLQTKKRRIFTIKPQIAPKIAIVLRNELFGGFIIVLIFFLLLLSSCASNATLTQSVLLQHASPASSEKAELLNTKLINNNAVSRQVGSSADYKIGPEDLLEIDVFQVPELKTSARVSAKGYIKLHLVDKIEASGLSVAELESLIAKRLEQYMTEPVVSVFVKEFRSQQVSVLGSVKNPLVYYVTGQKYLLDMLSLAGGLTPEAGTDCIVQTVTGGSTEKNARERIVIDLNELLIKGRTELNIPVHSGDVIQVPRSGIFFVTGSVQAPGEFQLRGKTTLTQALSMAKGLSFEASSSAIKIYRDTGNPQREVLDVDYDSILAGKTLDTELIDRDIIIIGNNPIKVFIKGLGGAINLGAVSLGKGY